MSVDTAALNAVVASLEERDRGAVLAIVATVEEIVEHLAKVGDAIGALNALDDMRAAELNELRLSVRLLCQAQGLETVGEPLVTLAARMEARIAETDPDEWDRYRHAYWQEINRLREARKAVSGDE